MRVLYLHPGQTPPYKDPGRNDVYYAPKPLCGDVLLPIRGQTPEGVQKELGPDSFPQHRLGNFTYHFFLAGRYSSVLLRKIATFRFYVREALRLAKSNNYDCVMTYGWTLTGMTGLLLARLLRAKLIVAIPNVPENAYKYNRFGRSFENPAQDLMTRVMRKASDVMLEFALLRADCARLYYPDQLSAYPKLANVPVYVTHTYARVAQIREGDAGDGSVLMVGAPWYVKGVDLLIRAFRMIEAEFPAARLRLVGHYLGQDFRELIGDSRQIEVLKARPNPEVLEMMARCSVFALASRTEALGTVLFEAMAAGRPVVAPRVGGIPYYVKDGVNGLLFERENVPELAAQLRKLLASPELRARLGRKGRELMQTRYNEAGWGRNFLEMVERTMTGGLASAEDTAVKARAANG